MLSRVFIAKSVEPLSQATLDQLPGGTTVAVLSRDGAATVDPSLATVHRTWVETRVPQVVCSLPDGPEWTPCSGRLRDQPLLLAAEACEALDLRGDPLPRTWGDLRDEPTGVRTAFKRRRRTPSPSPEVVAPEPPGGEESEESEDSDEDSNSDEDSSDNEEGTTAPDKSLAMLCLTALGSPPQSAWVKLAEALTSDDPPSRDRVRRLVAAALITTAP